MQKISVNGNLIKSYGHDPLLLLASIGGYYEVKKDANNKRLTPMVGYAGKYQTADGKALQYVGDVYANFAKAEEHPEIMHYLAGKLWEKLSIDEPVVFVGPAMGGIAVAQFLALHASKYIDARYACAEKKVTQLKTDTVREQATLQFGRHAVCKGNKVVICEDVLNNFSTTKELIELVESHGAKVVVIVGLLNRSMTIDDVYQFRGQDIEVIPLVRKPYPEYKQDDMDVKEDISSGNVVLKPKDEWSKLAQQAVI